MNLMENKKQASLAAVVIIEIIILLIAGIVMYNANLGNAEKHQNRMLESVASSMVRSYTAENHVEFMDHYSGKMKNIADTIAYLVSLDDSINAGNIGRLAPQFGVDDIVMGTAPVSEEASPGTFWFTSDKYKGTQVSVMVSNLDLADLSDNLTRMSYDFTDETGSSYTYLLMDSSTHEPLLWPGYSADDPGTASSFGFEPSDIPDGGYGRTSIDGIRYYAFNYADPALGVNAVVGVTEASLSHNALTAAGLMVLIMAAVMALITAFAYYTVQEDHMRIRTGTDPKNDTTARRKIITACVAAVALIAIAAFCIQTLFSISLASATISSGHEIMTSKQFRTEMDENGISKAYDGLCSSQTGIASYALTRHPELRTRKGLSDLSGRLGLEFIMLTDGSGKELMSDSPIVGYTLPKSRKGTNAYAYLFNDLLEGAKYRSVDLEKEVFGRPVRLSGMPVSNADNETDGIVLTAESAEVVNSVLADFDLAGILNNISIPFYLDTIAVNSDSHEFVFPDYQYVSAEEYGLKDEQIKDNYWGSMELNNTKAYTGTKKYGDSILLLSQPYTEMFNGRSDLTSLAVLVFVLGLLVMRLYFRFFGVREISRDESGDYIYIETAGGEVKSTRRALDRIFGTGVSSESYAEEKITHVWRVIQIVIAAVVALIFIFRSNLSYSNSIFGFIVDGKWERGPNVFSFAVIVTILMLYFVVMWVFDSVMQGLITIASPKNETFLRLIRSCVRYATVFAMIFYCMTLMGVDSTALLASAGLLTLIIGLGAQALITDILAGLFIIFEHDFQVGDIIEINGFRGRVVEIGIRSTRIMDFQQNIKTINNRNLTDFINRTRRSTFFDITIPVKPDQDIAAIEEMLREELPKLSEASPHIISGPVYNGIERVTTFHMYLSFRTQCSEEYRYSTMTLMNREITRLFREHGFTIGSGIN